MQEIKTVKKIDFVPWEYILYEVNDGCWVVKIPYETHMHVGTNMSILLTEDEKLIAEKDKSWLKSFSEKVRNNHELFIERKLDVKLGQKIYQMSQIDDIKK